MNPDARQIARKLGLSALDGPWSEPEIFDGRTRAEVPTFKDGESRGLIPLGWLVGLRCWRGESQGSTNEVMYEPYVGADGWCLLRIPQPELWIGSRYFGRIRPHEGELHFCSLRQTMRWFERNHRLLPDDLEQIIHEVAVKRLSDWIDVGRCIVEMAIEGNLHGLNLFRQQVLKRNTRAWVAREQLRENSQLYKPGTVEGIGNVIPPTFAYALTLTSLNCYTEPAKAFQAHEESKCILWKQRHPEWIYRNPITINIDDRGWQTTQANAKRIIEWGLFDHVSAAKRLLSTDTPNQSSATVSVEADRPTFLQTPSGWVIKFGGEECSLPPLKGLLVIARLLQAAHTSIAPHVLLDRATPHGADGQVDEDAIDDVKDEIRRLVADGVSEAAALEQLDRYVARGTTTNGLPRKLGGDAEKNRVALVNAYATAKRHIQSSLPVLGAHFDKFLTVATQSVYAPSPDVAWVVRVTGPAKSNRQRCEGGRKKKNR